MRGVRTKCRDFSSLLEGYIVCPDASKSTPQARIQFFFIPLRCEIRGKAEGPNIFGLDIQSRLKNSFRGEDEQETLFVFCYRYDKPIAIVLITFFSLWKP